MAEQWLKDAAIVEARMFRRDLISSGCEETIARNLSVFACCMLEDNSTLWTRADKDDELKLVMGIRRDRPLLQHDERLLPYWNRFTEALSSVAFGKRTCISFSLIQVQMSKEVMDMLVQSLKKAPVDSLYFYSNILGNDGYNSLVQLLNTNTSVKSFHIELNPIQTEDVATNLSKAIADHPNVDDVVLNKCGVGQKDAVMKSILPLLCLKEVYLDGNHIGSYGAKLISDSLATNPTLQKLYLQGNLLNDTDAKNLSKSLKTNTNLRMLDLSLNIITLDGKGSLALSVIDISCLNSDSNSTSLNAVSESNHTCLVKFTDEEDVLSLGQFNRYADPVSNKNIKLFAVLQRYHLKEDTPLQIIPKVLALLHNVARNQLDALFGFMKEWNMPLLYTSRLGKEPRRSNRVRKKMVKKCKGKK